MRHSSAFLGICVAVLSAASCGTTSAQDIMVADFGTDPGKINAASEYYGWLGPATWPTDTYQADAVQLDMTFFAQYQVSGIKWLLPTPFTPPAIPTYYVQAEIRLQGPPTPDPGANLLQYQDIEMSFAATNGNQSMYKLIAAPSFDPAPIPVNDGGPLALVLNTSPLSEPLNTGPNGPFEWGVDELARVEFHIQFGPSVPPAGAQVFMDNIQFVPGPVSDFTDVAMLSGSPACSVATVSGELYSLQYASSVTSDVVPDVTTWAELPYQVIGDGGTMVLPDLGASPGRTYRVMAGGRLLHDFDNETMGPFSKISSSHENVADYTYSFVDGGQYPGDKALKVYCNNVSTGQHFDAVLTMSAQDVIVDFHQADTIQFELEEVDYSGDSSANSLLMAMATCPLDPNGSGGWWLNLGREDATPGWPETSTIGQYPGVSGVKPIYNRTYTYNYETNRQDGTLLTGKDFLDWLDPNGDGEYDDTNSTHSQSANGFFNFMIAQITPAGQYSSYTYDNIRLAGASNAFTATTADAAVLTFDVLSTTRDYRLEYTDDILDPAGWTLLPYVFQSRGGVVTGFDLTAGAGSPERSYRVVEVIQ